MFFGLVFLGTDECFKQHQYPARPPASSFFFFFCIFLFTVFCVCVCKVLAAHFGCIIYRVMNWSFFPPHGILIVFSLCYNPACEQLEQTWGWYTKLGLQSAERAGRVGLSLTGWPTWVSELFSPNLCKAKIASKPPLFSPLPMAGTEPSLLAVS